MQLVAEPKNIKMENCGIRTICSHPQGKTWVYASKNIWIGLRGRTMDMVSPWNTPITLRKLFEYNRVWVYIQRIKRRERDDWTIFPRPHLSIPFLWINYLMGVYRLYFLHNVTLLNKSLFTQSLIDGGHGQAPPGLFQSQTSH